MVQSQSCPPLLLEYIRKSDRLRVDRSYRPTARYGIGAMRGTRRNYPSSESAKHSAPRSGALLLHYDLARPRLAQLRQSLHTRKQKTVGMVCIPWHRCSLLPHRTPIQDAMTPIPASSIAPVPSRPAPFRDQIDEMRQSNPEHGGSSQDRARRYQRNHEGHRDHDYRRDCPHQNHIPNVE